MVTKKPGWVHVLFSKLKAQEVDFQKISDPKSAVIVVETENSRYLFAIIDQKKCLIAIARSDRLGDPNRATFLGSLSKDDNFQMGKLVIGSRLRFEQKKDGIKTTSVIKSIQILTNYSQASLLRFLSY